MIASSWPRCRRKPLIPVINKSDLPQRLDGEALAGLLPGTAPLPIRISAKYGNGIEASPRRSGTCSSDNPAEEATGDDDRPSPPQGRPGAGRPNGSSAPATACATDSRRSWSPWRSARPWMRSERSPAGRHRRRSSRGSSPSSASGNRLRRGSCRNTCIRSRERRSGSSPATTRSSKSGGSSTAAGSSSCVVGDRRRRKHLLRHPGLPVRQRPRLCRRLEGAAVGKRHPREYRRSRRRRKRTRPRSASCSSAAFPYSQILFPS